MPTPLLDNRQIGYDSIRQNLLTNGGFEVWQRGTNSPFVCPAGGASNGMFSADRWQSFVLGTSALSILADATNQDTGSWRCIAATVTGGATVAQPAFIYQNVISSFSAGEGQELRGRTLSLSVRVKCSVANACRILIADVQGVNTYSAFHSGSGNYETLRVTASAPISANCTNGQAQVIFSANGTYYVDSAMLVVGEIPADYRPMHPADDLARCFRYCRRYFASVTLSPLSGYAYTSQNCQFILPMYTRMAVAPSVTVSSPADWFATTGVGQNPGSLSMLQAQNNHPDAVQLVAQMPAAGVYTVGQGSWLQNINGNAYILCEATP